ncbi:hypothetical protein PR048_024694 [Dryococelus australis]|uniref:Zinc finger PHD-type domain-containing protein n=1 Tax=Dryococelus australis TaxID=614101 RepID=A0ABQ9GPA2_9NEOP|nr:hypothetical protein PR048_024694 [Dryococelus australis]
MSSPTETDLGLPDKNNRNASPNTSSKSSKRKIKYESTSQGSSTKRKKKEDIGKFVPTVTLRVSDDDNDDVICNYCAEKFSASKSAEGWVQCLKCLSWSHEECTGVDTDDRGPFECDFCQFGI